MTDHTTEPSSDSDLRGRVEYLTQCFFERTLDENEEKEFAGLLDRSSELLDLAYEHYRVEHYLAFAGNLEYKELSYENPNKPIKSEHAFPDLGLAELGLERMFWDNFPKIDPPQSDVEDVFESRKPEPYKKLVPYDPKKNKSRFLPVVILLSSFVVLTMLIGYEFGAFSPIDHKKEPAFRPFARVSAVVDPVWQSETETFKLGQELESDRIRLQSGLIELELSNGVRLALEGPIDFQLNSLRSTFCQHGRLSATVSEKGRGFEVVTPLLTVVDLGTEFILDVSPSGIETHTLNGKTELKRLPTGSEAVVEGKAVRSDPQFKLKRFDADPTLFLGQREVARKMLESDRIRLDAWRESQAIWNNDPSLLVHFDFEEDGNIIVNRSARSAENGRLTGPTRSTGRWSGKKSVLFKRPRDAIFIDVPNELRSMTLSASIRVDTLKRHNQVLLSSTSLDHGHVVWQILKDGSLSLVVQGTDLSQPRRYVTTPALRRSLWGAWYHVACVLDTKKDQVVFYLDGKPVGMSELRGDGSFRIGPATIGNGLVRENRAADRFFDGAIDQFLIFDRALSEQEIERLHRQ